MTKQKEQAARDVFRKYAAGKINIKLIENMMSQGTPDAICINRIGSVFWLEFKAILAWPKMAKTCPLKNSFEKGQVPFMKEWHSWSGNAFVLLKADEEFYLLHPKDRIDLVEMNKAQIIESSVKVGINDIIEYLEGIA